VGDYDDDDDDDDDDAAPFHYQNLPPPVPLSQKGWDEKLTPHLHLLPRFRMRGAIPPLPSMSSWNSD
jgi:hypothetical protein